MTNVIHIRDAPSDWYLRPEEFAYAGRPGRGHNGQFGNPYPVDDLRSRAQSIQAFREYFYRRISDRNYRALVEAQKDKTLICFCKPKACHADVIAEWLDMDPEDR